jgi:hypothetical protein
MSVLFLHHPKETDLALFAGGELGPLARWRIERHIQTCAECEDAVADFFHLQGDVSELAELPPIDWAALSLSVREAVAEAPGKPESVGGGLWQRPLVWQAGLVSALLFCTIVVLDRYPSTPETTVATRFPSELRQTAPPRLGAKSAAMEADSLADANQETALGEGLAEQRKDNDSVAEPVSPFATVGGSSRSAFSTPDGQAQSAVRSSADSASPEPKERDAADERKSIEGAELARAVDSVLPGDVGARSTPGRPAAQSGLAQPAPGSAVGGDAAAEKAEESQSNTLALARRNAPRAAPPPASGPAENERPAAAESFRGRAGQQAQSGAAAPSALRAEMKVAPEAEALADRGAGQAVTPSAGVERGSGELRQSIAPSSGPGFSLPPGGLRVDTAVAADGGISFRSVDSRTGTITIYDVYAP